MNLNTILGCLQPLCERSSTWESGLTGMTNLEKGLLHDLLIKLQEADNDDELKEAFWQHDFYPRSANE